MVGDLVGCRDGSSVFLSRTVDIQSFNVAPAIRCPDTVTRIDITVHNTF